MKAWRLHSPAPAEQNPLRLEDLPIPQPGPGQVLLKVIACGVCHTDLHTVEGEIHPPRLPVTPGHQVVGAVEALGEGTGRVQLGQRVGVPWLHRADGTCPACLSGEENLCPNALFTGFDIDGGYAEFMLADEAYVLPIPDQMDPGQAASLLCAGIIGYRSLIKADVKEGEQIGLFGFGASAHLAIQMAHFWGCKVAVFTRSERHRDHARALGAAWTGGAAEEAPFHLDRAVIFAPAGELVPLALKKVRPGGTVAINAIHMSPIPQMDYGLIYGERTLRSVANATFTDGLELLRLAVEIPLKSTIARYRFEDANQAIVDLKHSRFNGEAVLYVSE